jgi:hypothetical protein
VFLGFSSGFLNLFYLLICWIPFILLKKTKIFLPKILRIVELKTVKIRRGGLCLSCVSKQDMSSSLLELLSAQRQH